MAHFPLVIPMDTCHRTTVRPSGNTSSRLGNKRLTPVWCGDQHWDNDMMDSFAMTRLERIQRRGSASRQRVLGTLIHSCDYRELSDEFREGFSTNTARSSSICKDQRRYS